MSIFVVEFKGDLPQTRGLTHPYATYSLDEMLQYVSNLFVKPSSLPDDYLGISPEFLPDPEDDRILIWEVGEEIKPIAYTSDSNGINLVWHFSGWHWSHDAEELSGGPLDQGTLPGIPEGETLYSLASHD